ncbi:hypothetical protein RHMOL_Rhmol01G0306900 [Rhododendron molle]|uniref:Uncharacterized protein n=1 Tax=Rhododendron molle TaxID=49168 RepID=A0ACC0Q8Q7_RHOML|nr:hypothetical protein RHMOL_Rhmol01G0306900 [Rhododendron molle]
MSGRGKGGKGLGKGGAKRHRKVLRDNIQGITKPANRRLIADALNAPSKAQALQIIKEKDPKSFVLQFHNINSNLEKIFKPPTPTYTSPFSNSTFINIPQELKQWALDNVKDPAARPDRPISIIIEGPSRIGKTVWARSLGPHNYLAGYLDLNSDVYSNNAWYNVIDGVDPHYLKHWKDFIGAEKDWQSNCKYGKKPTQISGGIPAIVLCNPGEGSSYNDYLNKAKNNGLRRWTIKNSKFIFLDKTPLYSTAIQPPVSEADSPSSQNTTTEN